MRWELRSRHLALFGSTPLAPALPEPDPESHNLTWAAWMQDGFVPEPLRGELHLANARNWPTYSYDVEETILASRAPGR